MLARTRYRTVPDHERTAFPAGVPFIVGNEAAERFSFYGMKAILFFYIAYLFQQTGMAEELAKDEATAVTHLFNAAVYALPVIGAVIADRWLGKYRTIMLLSLVYCAGHAVLAIFDGQLFGAYLGLTLIAVGSGGIKPCVSAHVGDQFGRKNVDRMKRIFDLFYFSINFGAFFSSLLIPWMKDRWGYSTAFAVPGILMGVATVVFWMGRHRFVHIQPTPGGKLGFLDTVSSALLFMSVGHFFFTGESSWGVKLGWSIACFGAGIILFEVRQHMEKDDGFMAVMMHAVKSFFNGDRFSRLTGRTGTLETHWFFGSATQRFGSEAAEGAVAVIRIASVFVLVSVFWALFDQYGSSWLRQGNMMVPLAFQLPFLGTVTVTAEQIQAVNPIMVMVLIPAASFGFYPMMERIGFTMTPLRRMSLGMFVAALSFVAVALLQKRIDLLATSKQQLNLVWQLVPYLIITVAEVMVSITGLDFAYTQAPKRMKSTIMSFWLLTVSLGNVFVALLARFGNLSLVDFFWVFAGIMAATAIVFSIRAALYKGKDYTQGV